MLEIQDRRNVFYWQTDRNLSSPDYEKHFLKRHEVPNSELTAVLEQGITTIPSPKVVIEDLDNEVKKGNVNIVRKVQINGEPFIARMHPFGIKNGYFYVEQVALRIAQDSNIPVPQILEVHEARNESDMDFVLMTVAPGVTMETVIGEKKTLEADLLHQAGVLMASIHKIGVEKYGPFDNEVAKSEGRLVGLHGTYKEFIECGLEENIQRLISFGVINDNQAEKFRDVFKEHDFEPRDGPKLIHNDFADWNILVSDKKISGVLDWDECHGGDPIADLACWSTFFDMERFSKFLEGYTSIGALPDDFDTRFHYYRLRYTISKMALRVKRAQVDHSEFIQEKIKVGKKALNEEIQWFDQHE